MPVRRFFTFRTLDAAVAGSNGGGGGVVDLSRAAKGGDHQRDPEAQD
jgi:hypothetical protein